MRAMKAAMKAKKAPAMKVKAMKAMKAMKAKKAKTVGGLTADKLTKNKAGKVVSKKSSARGKKNKWSVATAAARKELKIKGFCPVGGKSEQGKKLLAKVRAIMKK